MAGVVAGLRIDLKRLHETWMEIVFPRQRNADRSVLGKWKPQTASGKLAYRLWGAIGALFVALLYPFALAGTVVRWAAYNFDDLGDYLGVLGTVVIVALLWGALSALARFQFSFAGFIAVVVAAAVATVSAGLAVAVSRIGGRTSSILVAYPLGMTAVFLPPVVAAFYSPALGQLVFTESESLAIWFLETVLAVGDINEYLRTQYDLTGIAYVLMWLGVAIPLGWILGVLVSLAELARPTN
ncbi:hypothetical protein [Haloarchaeobius sp. HME9146]|uniref:hypothetical protein n=1 Tax=Haloarchaeobius sp. HME9146 TaxID=2978732 RepID=UPI0021BFF24B|nr:hypothetical protein [Haloarchaeobius sp. HME9146]MCT9095891.1 hypothetical protein [Haloarchaeobius sp. HME9146]